MKWDDAPDVGEGRCPCGAPAVLLYDHQGRLPGPPFCVATAWDVANCNRLERRAIGGQADGSAA